MSALIFSMLMYMLGFTGLVAIGLLPFRCWQVLRNVFRKNSLQTPSKVFGAIAVVLTALVLWSDVQIATRIARCLTQSYCGPGVASGWTYLAVLGAVYVGFEMTLFAAQPTTRIKTIRPPE